MYFIKEVVAASEVCPELVCPHCQTSGEIEVSIIRIHMSAGFIPMLAWNKHGEAKCLHCGLSVNLKGADESFNRAYQTLKAENRTPMYHSAGMILCIFGLFAIFGYMFYEGRNNPYSQKIEQTLLDAPKVGDLYEVSIDELKIDKKNSTLIRKYALAKVERVEKDSVTLRYGKDALEQPHPPMFKELLKKPVDFGDKIAVVRKKRLVDKELCPSGSSCIGQVYAVKRP